MWSDIELKTEDLLDQVDKDDLINYLYEKKLISHQVVKKYFGIKDICEKPDISYWTRFDLEDLGISEEDILFYMSDDDIYDYLCDSGYDFPVPEETEDEYISSDNFQFVSNLRTLLNNRFGKTWTKEELKKQFNDAIDFYLV